MDLHLRQEIHQLHAKICAGLADPIRILILYALHETPRYVTELADFLELPQPTVSRHLRVLRERGLVSSERASHTVTYSISDKRIIEALDLMREVLADQLKSQIDLLKETADEVVSA